MINTNKRKPVSLCEDMQTEYKHDTVSCASYVAMCWILMKEALRTTQKVQTHQNVIFPKV